MFLQTPMYVLGGLAETFGLTNGTEYANSLGPKNEKSVIQPTSLAMAAGGSLHVLAVAPVSFDPSLVTMFSCVVGPMGLFIIVFLACFEVS